jgi:hypothetical protein
MPDVTNEWPARSAGASPRLASDLRLARDRKTTLLGHLMAPLAVRYIVVPNRLAPASSGSAFLSEPADITTGLGLQVDLRTVPTDAAVTVYENSAWAAERILLPDAAVAASQTDAVGAPQLAALGGATPVLPGGSHDHFTGSVPGGGDVFISATNSQRWALSAGGRAASRRAAFGWAMAFSPQGDGGPASLRFHTPITRPVAVTAEMLLWLVVLAALVMDRRRSGPAPSEPMEPQAGASGEVEPRPEPTLVGIRWRSRRPVEPVGIDPSDEDWA